MTDTSIVRILNKINRDRSLFIRVNPYNEHIIYDLYEHNNQGKNIDYNCSCFYIPPFFKDLFKLPLVGNRIYKSGDPVMPKFKNMHFYQINPYSHHSIIIYLNVSKIYYIDYYSETGRESPLRIEKITKTKLNKYISALIGGDLDEVVKFHMGNDKFRQMLTNAKFLLEDISEQQIKYIPQLSDVLRVILSKSHCDQMDYTDEDLEDLESKKAIEKAKILGYQELAENKLLFIANFLQK